MLNLQVCMHFAKGRSIFPDLEKKRDCFSIKKQFFFEMDFFSYIFDGFSYTLRKKFFNETAKNFKINPGNL